MHFQTYPLIQWSIITSYQALLLIGIIFTLVLQIFCFMLKALFTRIKSEKSEALSSKKDKEIEPKLQKKIMKPISQYQFKQLTQNSEVTCGISRIRYSVEPEAPQVFNRILSCPISVFNVLPYGKRKVKEIDLRVQYVPQYIKQMGDLLSCQLPHFNHLLINVYPPGVGIMPHFDGPMYKSKVVVLSLGGPAIINFTENYQGVLKLGSLLLEDQSIHIFQGHAYEQCLHGISNFCVDSIFLKVQKSEEVIGFEIKSASVSNFTLTRLYKAIRSIFINDIPGLTANKEVELTKQYGSPCCLIPILGNESYNYKVEVHRQQRISVTIREKIIEK